MRYAPLTVLALLLSAVQAPALTVVYIDRETKKEIEVVAGGMDVDESPAGITIKKGAGKEVTYRKVGMVTQRQTKAIALKFPIKVAPADVKDYQPGEADVPKSVTYLLEYRPPLANVERAANLDLNIKPEDRLKLMNDSLALFETQMPKVLSVESPAGRHFAFRYVETLFKLTQKDDKLREKAIKALGEFQKNHSAAWQISLALEMLARLQEDTGDLEAMQKTYEALAATAGVSDEVKINSLLAASRTLMKLNRYGDAQKKLTELKGALAADNPLAGKVGLYLAQCHILGDNATEAQQAEQQVRQFLGTTDDKALKALAHNTLGDYYAKLKRDEDAFWEYLKVDTLYSDDKFEHARAMYHLIRLFREVKQDGERSTQYEETLTKDPRFAGLEWQKKAMKK